MNNKAVLLFLTIIIGGFNLHNSALYFRSSSMSKVAMVEINVRSDSEWGLLEISGLGYTAYMDHVVVESSARVVDRRGGETLREYWRLAEGQPWILVTSWNEWHEGTELEPSLELGEEFLELLGGLSASWRDP